MNLSPQRPFSPLQLHMGEMHARRLAHQREVLAFLRAVTPPRETPMFRAVARQLREAGRYSPKTALGSIESALRRVWGTRHYLDSSEADRQYRGSPTARMGVGGVRGEVIAPSHCVLYRERSSRTASPIVAPL